jgi:cytoskeletal protein RodZ
MSEHQSLGGVIRASRENSGYTISDLEKITRIPTAIIRDIEKDKFESSGGTTYARGHIRSIAKVLRADSEKWLERFEEQTGEVDRPMFDLLAENNVTSATPAKRNISYKTLGIAAAMVAVLSIAIPAGLSFTKSNKPAAAPTVQDNSNAAPNNVVATKTSGVVVVLTGIDGQSWVGIQDAAGAQVFSGRISVGQSKTFTDAQQLNVTIGNSGAVNLNVNGKDLGAPGNVGEVVHLSFGPNESNQG